MKKRIGEEEALKLISEGEAIMQEVCMGMLNKKPKEWFLTSGITQLRLALDKILSGELALYGKGDATAERVKEYIYAFRGERVSKFMEWFVELFDVEWMMVDMGLTPEEAFDFILSMAMNAWNAYPHDELGGKAPFEIEVMGEFPPADEELPPVFERFLIQLVESGCLPEDAPAMVKERVYNEDGSSEAFDRFRRWFLGMFPAELDGERRLFADYIAEKAWRYYPHRALGGRSPLQRRIEKVKRCERSGDGECFEGGLYVCEECERVFCFLHGSLHLLENEGKGRPHVLRPVDDYLQYVRGMLSRLKP